MNKNGKIIDKNGNSFWYKDNVLHREDGPACEFANGAKYYYKYGQWHREGGPACEFEDGAKYWCKEGNFHREDGPALEAANGDKYWHFNDKEIPCSSQEEFERIINLKLFW
jgi:hypothetical protein